MNSLWPQREWTCTCSQRERVVGKKIKRHGKITTLSLPNRCVLCFESDFKAAWGWKSPCCVGGKLLLSLLVWPQHTAHLFEQDKHANQAEHFNSCVCKLTNCQGHKRLWIQINTADINDVDDVTCPGCWQQHVLYVKHHVIVKVSLFCCAWYLHCCPVFKALHFLDYIWNIINYCLTELFLMICDWPSHCNCLNQPHNKKKLKTTTTATNKNTATLSTTAFLTNGTFADAHEFGCFMSLSNHNVFFIDFPVWPHHSFRGREAGPAHQKKGM